MIRQIIRIDEERCNGCGLCAKACHEGAITLVNGKARLIRDDYCDGLGNCLPVCPTGAISFEEREAAAYDEEAVKSKQAEAETRTDCGCPGSTARTLQRQPVVILDQPALNPSELRQWPVQIKLAPVNAPYFENANLLIAADCSAFAYGDFHRKFIRNHVTLIGCPKLDQVDYSDKLTAIIGGNAIKSIKVVRMQVPCCGGIEIAVVQALKNSGKVIPWQVVVLTADGRILEE